MISKNIRDKVIQNTSIVEVVSGYLNTHSVNATVVYLNESEWDELRENVALGNASWENNVIYMIYSND